MEVGRFEAKYHYKKEIDTLKNIKNKIDSSCVGGFCDDCLNFQLRKKRMYDWDFNKLEKRYREINNDNI